MQIESFAIACKNLGLDPKACLPDVSNMPVKHRAALTATAKLYIITEAANEGKEFDWNDRGQLKWYAWFDMEVDKNNPSGFRFHGSIYSVACADAGAGSRLCFFTEADAIYHGKQHEDLYRVMMHHPKSAKKVPKKK